MRKTTRKVAFLLTPGFLGFDFNIFHCNTFCLVYLPVQHCRKPISGNPDLSIQKQGFLDGFLAAVLVGESPTGRNCPVAAVVISSDETGDPIIGSLEVKVSDGWGNPVRSAEGGEQTDRS